MVDLIAEFETENGPSYDKWFWGLPYDKQEEMLKHSPYLYLKNAHTPILIPQGINDTTDPLGQSTGLYRGLKFYGAPAELVEYPRENHGFHEEKHELDRLNRILRLVPGVFEIDPESRCLSCRLHGHIGHIPRANALHALGLMLSSFASPPT